VDYTVSEKVQVWSKGEQASYELFGLVTHSQSSSGMETAVVRGEVGKWCMIANDTVEGMLPSLSTWDLNHIPVLLFYTTLLPHRKRPSMPDSEASPRINRPNADEVKGTSSMGEGATKQKGDPSPRHKRDSRIDEKEKERRSKTEMKSESDGKDSREMERERERARSKDSSGKEDRTRDSGGPVVGRDSSRRSPRKREETTGKDNGRLRDERAHDRRREDERGREGRSEDKGRVRDDRGSERDKGTGDDWGRERSSNRKEGKDAGKERIAGENAGGSESKSDKKKAGSNWDRKDRVNMLNSLHVAVVNSDEVKKGKEKVVPHHSPVPFWSTKSVGLRWGTPEHSSGTPRAPE